MKTTTKAVLVVATLVALAYAGAAGVHATTDAAACQEDEACWDCETMGNLVCGPTLPDTAVEPTLGATIQSRVYLDQGRSLIVRNDGTARSTFSFEPSGGWGVEPASVELDPTGTATVLVTGDGEDGATIIVRVSPVADEGSPSQLVLNSLVFFETPFDLGRFVGGLIPYLAIAAGAGWLLWRLKPWQIRLTRTTR